MTERTPQMEQPVDLTAPRKAQTIICTLGMHRSGTSLVSRILNLLGVHLGEPEAIGGKAPDNPTGYWEHHPIALLNDEILAAFGGRWDEPPAFPPSWLGDARLDNVRERARQILAGDFAAAPLWGWKDPRSCLTMPFWQDLVGGIRYVICVRNPSEVVASLASRDGIAPETSERLWLTYVQASLMHTSDRPRMFVFYDDLINDWARDLSRMAAFIGRPDRATDPSVHASVRAFLANELRHHHRSTADLLGDPQISFPSKSLYLALRSSVARGGADAHGTLDLFGAQAKHAYDDAAEMAARGDRQVRELHERAGTIADLGAEQDRLTAAAIALGAERGQLAGALVSVRAERDRLTNDIIALGVERDRLATLGAAAAERASALSRERDAAVEALDAIEASRAWRIVARSRRVVAAVLPAGTGRRRAFDALVHRLAGRRPSPPSGPAIDSQNG